MAIDGGIGAADKATKGDIGALSDFDGEAGGGGNSGDDFDTGAGGLGGQLEADATGESDDGTGGGDAAKDALSDGLVEGVMPADVFTQSDEFTGVKYSGGMGPSGLGEDFLFFAELPEHWCQGGFFDADGIAADGQVREELPDGLRAA